MNTSLKNPRAVLLPLYLALYDKLRPERRQALLPFLAHVREFLRAKGLSLVECGIVTTPAEVRRAVAAAQEADIVITLHLSYSPSLLIADALQKLGRPILLLDTTKADHFDEKSTATDVGENHGIHGVMDLASVLTGRGVPFEVVAGAWRDRAFSGRVDEALRVLRAASLWRNQRIGLTGQPFPGMGDFAVRFAELQQRFGATVEEVSVPQIVAAGRKIPTARIDAEVEADRQRYELHQVDGAAHRAAVRDYLALSALIARRGLTAYSMNFQHVTRGIPTPFYACSRLMSDGIGYAGEGDVLTALLGRPLNFLAGEAVFSEMFCPDWRGGTLLMAHMGEFDVRFASPRRRPLLTQKKPLMNDQFSVYPMAGVATRPVTVVNLARDAAGGFRLVLALADLMPFGPKLEFGMPHFKMKPRRPLEGFLEEYARQGGGHHIFLATGDQRAVLGRVARQLALASAEI